MWKNFVLTAIRNINKNKTYAFINIFGLSVGLASAILIILFVVNELSFDHYHEKAGRIYRLYIQGKFEGDEFKSAFSCKPAGPTFTEEIEGVENYTRLDATGQNLVKYKDNKYIEKKLVYADSGVFNVFSLHMIEGDPETALKEPNTLVLTESSAKKYFGNEEAMGKVLSINSDTSLYRVTGIIEDLPENTHLDFNMLASYSTLPESRENFWISNNLYTYILLNENADLQNVQDQVQAVALKYIEPELEQILGIDTEQFQAKGNEYGIFLQGLEDIHLNTDIEGGFKPVNDKKYVLIFAIIAFFILLIAAINFMNLSTAKSANRAKEVGMRKVVGSSRILLVRQFLWESILLSFLSLVFALIIVELLLPYFNNLVGMKFSLDYSNWYTIPGLLLLTLIIGILSGSYPSFVLASFRPVNVLKGQVIKGVKGGLLRNILVVVQFTISIIIITGTITVYSQLHYLLNKDLGFDKEQVVVMDRVWPLDKQIQTFIQEVEKLPGVKVATNSTSYPGITNNSNAYQIKGRDLANNYILMTNWADYDFLNTFGLKISEGRYFRKDFPSDTAVAVLNETAVKNFKLEDPMNTVMMMPTEDGKGEPLRVVGVVKDFHYSSLKSPIEPYILLLKRRHFDWAGFISIKLQPGEQSYKSVMRSIEETWNRFKPGEPFLYFFLNEHFERMYKEEIRTGKLSLIFSILAIIIASLGLFGLTMFTTEKKTKEIGIRKVMGAGIKDIILMIIRDISILMAISIVLAWGISYKITSNWLEDFPSRIDLSVWIFIASALIAFIIAVITVSIQAWRAARANPVESLHYE